MSATNRGSIRHDSDFYETPTNAIKSFFNVFELSGMNILEPCAGHGAISSMIRKEFPMRYLHQVEIREGAASFLDQYGSFEIKPFNDYWGKNADTIITNPPYSIAQDIIEHCFEISMHHTEIIMLLRLAFLESKKRSEFWKRHPLTQLYVLSERPSFTGKGTDATAYGWFVWSNQRNSLIKTI